MRQGTNGLVCQFVGQVTVYPWNRLNVAAAPLEVVFIAIDDSLDGVLATGLAGACNLLGFVLSLLVRQDAWVVLRLIVVVRLADGFGPVAAVLGDAHDPCAVVLGSSVAQQHTAHALDLIEVWLLADGQLEAVRPVFKG